MRKFLLQIIVLIVAIALIVSVVLQSKGAGLGGLFGGDGGGAYRTRRGAEKYLFNFTIILSILFFLFTILSFIALG